MKLVAPLFFVFAFPFVASAQVVITEIMYDPKDADAGSGGEWIEVHNTGSVATDLTQWIFFEAETNHGVTADGVAEIPPGGYAVISRDLVAFKNYFSDFSGALFKASFSLNDGEEIAMKSGKDAMPSGSVSYITEWGAKNDGNSLQLVLGEWVAAPPTPGAENSTSERAEPPPVVNSQIPPPTNTSTPPPPSGPLFTARISEKEKFAVVGAPAKFKGDTVGTTEGLSGKTRFIWNFGDGGTAEGQSVLHVYKYPGDYVVVLNVVSGTHATEDRAIIKAIPAELSITNIGPAHDFFIELSNNSSYEMNLSGWLLKSGTRYFVIPEHSFILPKKKIVFSGDTTGLPYSGESSVELLYPNGLTAAVFSTYTDSPVLSLSIPIKKAEVIPVVKTVTPQKIASPPPSDFPDESPAFAAALPQKISKQTATQGKTFPWLFGTLALVVLGGAGVIIARRKKTPADEFAITEEGNDTL